MFKSKTKQNDTKVLVFVSSKNYVSEKHEENKGTFKIYIVYWSVYDSIIYIQIDKYIICIFWHSVILVESHFINLFSFIQLFKFICYQIKIISYTLYINDAENPMICSRIL